MSGDDRQLQPEPGSPPDDDDEMPPSIPDIAPVSLPVPGEDAPPSQRRLSPPPKPKNRPKRDSLPPVEVAISKPRAQMITIPDDDVPVGAVPRPLQAMQIVAVGSKPPPTPSDDSEDGSAIPDETLELDAEDLDELEAPPITTRGGVVPPPPPSEAEKRAARERRARAQRMSAAQRPQRKPWWEEVFSEDFSRADAPLLDHQIDREVAFIEESLGIAAGGVVLDLGCGAGHHAVGLASRGYGVVGYDLSLFQLSLAAEVAQEKGQKINFLQGDMREMAFEEMFDGVYCWNTTFGYFEEEKNVAVAERVFRSLRPGGMFLLDVMNRDFAASQHPSQVWYEGDACICMDDMSMDFLTSRMRVKRSVILEDGRTRERVYSIRAYGLHELGKILHDVGFRVTEASGHLATPGVFFGQNSPRIIVLAQKP